MELPLLRSLAVSGITLYVAILTEGVPTFLTGGPVSTASKSPYNIEPSAIALE